MKTWRRIRIDARRARIPLMIGVLAWLGSHSAEASSSLQADPDRPLVIDRAGVLDDDQERSAVNDVYRLNLYAIPTQVITEPVGLNQSQADARADELRVSQGIESSPGADDGLLFYTSTDPYDPAHVVMSISPGDRTLPRNGFTAAALDDIRVDIMEAQLAQGHPARAIVYSLREMIYLEQYVPPPPPVLSGWRSEAQPIADVLIPVLAVTGGAWLQWQGRSNQGSDGIGISIRHVLVTGGLAGGLMFLAVATRNQTGALATLILSGLVLWRAIALDRAPSAAARAITLSPRRPGWRRLAQSSRTSAR